MARLFVKVEQSLVVRSAYFKEVDNIRVEDTVPYSSGYFLTVTLTGGEQRQIGPNGVVGGGFENTNINANDHHVTTQWTYQSPGKIDEIWFDLYLIKGEITDTYITTDGAAPVDGAQIDVSRGVYFWETTIYERFNGEITTTYYTNSNPHIEFYYIDYFWVDLGVIADPVPLFTGGNEVRDLNALNTWEFILGPSVADALGGNDRVTLPTLMTTWTSLGVSAAADGKVHFSAGSGNDYVTTGPLDDWIDGGPGQDTVVLQGKIADYEIGPYGTSLLLRRGDQSDWLSGVEVLKFSNGSLDVASLAPATSADIFVEHGKLSFFATLSAAAYALLGAEPIGDTTNTPASAGAKSAYSTAKADLVLLNSGDLPSLKPAAAAGPFSFVGIRDGIYVNQNAAALIGRSADGLFVAFRGTNDEFALTTPDHKHWVSKGDHWALFAPLVSALKTYLAANPAIKTIYVTGHSLGGAMVQPMVDALSGMGLKIEAATFASPGYGLGGDKEDDRITNFWTDDDIIRGPEFLSGVSGGKNTLVDGIFDTILPNENSHYIDLYQAITRFLNDEGIDLPELAKLNGVDYENIVLKVTDSGGRKFAVGTKADKLEGTGSFDLMLGGALGDRLAGGKGIDTLLGGDGPDQLAGGKGRDYLRGGADKDRFIFDVKGVDTIEDFESGDRIVLSRSYFDELKRGKLQDQAFVTGKAARDAKDRIIFDEENGRVLYDPDGKKGAKAEPFASIDVSTLKASDFLVID
jgi:Ca2+-binding RTX toxin-like protein